MTCPGSYCWDLNLGSLTPQAGLVTTIKFSLIYSSTREGKCRGEHTTAARGWRGDWLLLLESELDLESTVKLTIPLLGFVFLFFAKGRQGAGHFRQKEQGVK